VIAKVVHGWRPGGLLRYVFGPGKHEEHENPRVVASWDGAPWMHHPAELPAVEVDGERIEPGPFDLDLGPLTATMQELAEAAGLPVSNPPPITPEWTDWLRSGRALPLGAPAWVRQYRYDPKKQAVVQRAGYVWHCPVRLHPTDRTLTDQEWEHVAARLMRATGIQQAGCRWVAVRHADDHIHLVATLVSEYTGKRFYPRNDYVRLREECRGLEREYGLVPTAAADKTALRAPTRAEQGKTARKGRDETVREELRRVVAQCAAATGDGPEFLARLSYEGVRWRTALDAEGEVRGYSVALSIDRTAAGLPVWFSGTKLGRDLTWPKLQQRWGELSLADSSTDTGAVPASDAFDDMTTSLSSGTGRMSPAQRREFINGATAVVERATETARAGRDVDGIAHATGEILAVLTRGQEGRDQGPLGQASDRYDRAARTPHRVLPRQMGPVAIELRRASRRIARIGMLSGRGQEKVATLALLLALAGLIAEIAAWQQTRGRIHQAASARSAADMLSGLVGPAETVRRPTVRPTQPAPVSAPGDAFRERTFVRREVAGLGESRLARRRIGGFEPPRDPRRGRTR
jgi:hypothetical protein